jgi:hypothetical protein
MTHTQEQTTVVTADATPEPLTLDERLALAYHGAVPPGIKQFYDWELTTRAITADQVYQTGEQAKQIARTINARAEVARGRIAEARARLTDLEKRLIALNSEYSAACAYVETDPPPTASAWDVGKIAIIKAGAEKLLPVLTRAVETARAEPARAELDARNWKVLADLADVVAGVCSPTDILAQKLDLAFAWQVCPPLLRSARERERREALERARAEAPRREAERLEAQRRASMAAERLEARQAAIAEIDSLDFEGLIGFVFSGNEGALDDMPTLNRVIALWPDRPDAGTSQAAIAELRVIGATDAEASGGGCRIPISSRDVVFNRAVNRLASVIYS